MNLESRHFINGVEIRPKNADDIGLKMDWSGNTEEAELTTDSIVLENLAKKLVIEHIETLGIFEGLPYTFMVGNFSLDYYIDLTDNPLISGVGDSAVEVTIKRRRAIDWFKQQANGLSFESLNRTNPINVVNVPYLIIKDNQAEMLIMLIISIYTLQKALAEAINEVVEAIAEVTAAATPNVGVPPSINLGAVINAVVLAAARIIYTLALIGMLLDMIGQIIELIFPPLRKFKGATVLELMQKGCTKLGMTFQSSIIEGMPQLTIVGVPLKKNKQSILNQLNIFNSSYFNKGYPTARDFAVSTLGKLMDALQEMFNAKFRIIGNNIVFERRDYWVLNSGLTITNTLNLQNVRENQWGYNTGDAWKRYYMRYQYDISDWHTMDNLDDTDCEYSTEPVSVVNADLVSIKGLVEISIPFAYGTRKNSLTFVEEFAATFCRLADTLINFLGGDSSFESSITGRIGVMMIGQEFFSTTKLIYQVNGRQPSNYRGIIGANSLYQEYHSINEVKANFKRIYTERIPFSTDNFLMLLNNNYVLDQNGNSLEILTFEWINESKTAEITYSELSNEGNNTETILIDA